MSNLRILSLDQSSKTGWAFAVERSADPYLFGSFKMPKRDDPGERLMIFRDGLEDLIFTHKPDLIGFEEPIWPAGTEWKFSVATVSLLHMLKGVLKELCARHSIPAEGYASSAWRVTALGMGRLPKGSETGEWKRMMKRKALSLGYAVKDDNEADAIGILMHMLHGRPANERAQGDLLERAVNAL